MTFLIMLGLAGWPIAAFVHGQFSRHRPISVALSNAVLWLFIALCVGITLIDLHAAMQASQPAGASTRVLLLLSILWFSLPYVGLCAWWIR